MDDELKMALLRNLSKEDIKELFDVVEEPTVKEDMLTDPIPPSQKFYLSRRIPGSTKICPYCSQFIVNDEEHATELIGGENQ